MRLLLDARISGPRVGEAFGAMGHNVRAVDQEKELERSPDDLLFELAVSDDRVLVTHNARDFLQVVRDRPPEKNHAGLIPIPYSVKLYDFDEIIRGVQNTLTELPQEDWANRVRWLRR